MLWRYFFQAEDGIRDLTVTGVQTCAFFFSSRRRHTRFDCDGVQTCALPISSRRRHTRFDCDWSSDVCSSDLGRTFRWTGQYSYDLNEAKTLDTQLNVFAEFRPSLGDGLRRAPFVFLANIDPELQLDVLRQMQDRPRLVALDTMNFWIQGKQEALRP